VLSRPITAMALLGAADRRIFVAQEATVVEDVKEDGPSTIVTPAYMAYSSEAKLFDSVFGGVQVAGCFDLVL